MSISMPSYFMFNLRNMDERYKQTVWDSLSDEEKKASDAEWKNLRNNGSAFARGGTTTISSTPSEARFNSDSKGIAASRDTTFSATPTTAALSGFNSLLSRDTAQGLIFVDLRNANSDASRAGLAASAFSIMTGRFGGAQGVLGVDLNDNGFIDDASELFGNGGGTRAGYVDFVIDPSRLSAGDRITFSAARAAGGAAQSFDVTDETSVALIAAAINREVAEGRLSGVDAGVVDGRLRLTARGADGQPDLLGTVTGSLIDRTGDVIRAATLQPADGEGAPGRADIALAGVAISGGDLLRFTLSGGDEQSFAVTTETTLDALVRSINGAVEDGRLSGIAASNENGTLRLTATDAGTDVAAASLLDRTADVTRQGNAFLGDGMQRIADYVAVDADGRVTWTSEKKAMVLSSGGHSTYANLSVGGLIEGRSATVTTSLVMTQNQGARIDVAV